MESQGRLARQESTFQWSVYVNVKSWVADGTLTSTPPVRFVRCVDRHIEYTICVFIDAPRTHRFQLSGR